MGNQEEAMSKLDKLVRMLRSRDGTCPEDIYSIRAYIEERFGPLMEHSEGFVFSEENDAYDATMNKALARAKEE